LKKIALYAGSRLLQSGLTELLAAQPGVDRVVPARHMGELASAASRVGADVVLFELRHPDSQEGWSGHLDGVRRAVPAARLVALTASRQVDETVRRNRPGVINGVVSIRCGVEELLGAVGINGHAVAGPVQTIDLRDPPRRSQVPSLTRRELDILNLVRGGLTTAGIAAELGISTKTIENHKQRIYAKLGVQSQSHAVAIAVQEGLLSKSGTVPRRQPGMAPSEAEG